MTLVFEEVFPDPANYVAQLKSVPVPEDLVQQFERVSKQEVIAAHVSRFSRAVAERPQDRSQGETPHSGPQDLGIPSGSSELHMRE